MKVSDLVILKKDVDPIIYIIEEINDEDVLLKGYTHRIVRKTNWKDNNYSAKGR